VSNATVEALVFLTVTVCRALVAPLAVLKVRLAGLREMGLVIPVADEVTFTTSGTAPGASSVMMIAPLFVADVGMTCTFTVQLAPAASGADPDVQQFEASIW